MVDVQSHSKLLAKNLWCIMIPMWRTNYVTDDLFAFIFKKNNNNSNCAVLPHVRIFLLFSIVVAEFESALRRASKNERVCSSLLIFLPFFVH